MNSKLIFAAVVGVTMILCACGHSGDDGSASNSNYFRYYKLSGDSCDTGEHKFTGDNYDEVLRDYCYELRDGSKNNFCAEQQRYDLFDQKCGTYAWN
jgi:hypothetical protein